MVDQGNVDLLKNIYGMLGRNMDKLDGDLKGREWIELGFQNEDPSSDFRGTGQLGLLNLHHFIALDPNKAKNMLEEANVPENHYFFACAGINITYKILFMLVEDRFKLYNFHNCKTKEEALKCFNMMYTRFFEDFHAFWMSSNLRTSIINFSIVLNDCCERFKQARQ